MSQMCFGKFIITVLYIYSSSGFRKLCYRLKYVVLKQRAFPSRLCLNLNCVASDAYTL